jgi:hypothetical protein
MRSFLVRFIVLAILAGSVAGAQTQAPPIDVAALQDGAHGNGSILGSTNLPFTGATAFCVPAIPYTYWYFDSLGQPGQSPMYDSRLIAFTRRAPIGKQGSFMFSGLAPGRYIVWISGDQLLGVLTYGPPIASKNASQGQTSNLMSKFVKLVDVGYGAAITTF